MKSTTTSKTTRPRDNAERGENHLEPLSQKVQSYEQERTRTATPQLHLRSRYKKVCLRHYITSEQTQSQAEQITTHDETINTNTQLATNYSSTAKERIVSTQQNNTKRTDNDNSTINSTTSPNTTPTTSTDTTATTSTNHTTATTGNKNTNRKGRKNKLTSEAHDLSCCPPNTTMEKKQGHHGIEKPMIMMNSKQEQWTSETNNIKHTGKATHKVHIQPLHSQQPDEKIEQDKTADKNTNKCDTNMTRTEPKDTNTSRQGKQRRTTNSANKNTENHAQSSNTAPATHRTRRQSNPKS